MRLVALLCAAPVMATRLSFAAAAARPLDRVVKLLGQMQTTLQEEGEADEAQFKKLTCWCNTNKSEKKAAIEAAQTHAEELRSEIESLTAHVAELGSLLETTLQQLAQDEASLAEATEVREKEAAAFHAEHKDTLASVQNLKAAITTLDKHYGAGGSAALLAQLSQRGANSSMAAVARLLRSRGVSLAQGVSGGEIMGTLRQMLETMAGDAVEAEKREQAAATSFVEMRKAKRAQIDSSKKMIVEKTAEKTQSAFRLADSKEDLEATEEQLKADSAFLADAKATCADGAESFSARQADRAKEVAAVGDALAILGSDHARDTFRSAHNGATAFLQTSKAARAPSVLALVDSASTAQLDAFKKVKAEIEKMVAHLKEQQKAEADHRDGCNSSIHQNELATVDAEHLKEDTAQSISDLEAALEKLQAEHAAAEAQLSATLQSLQGASEGRQEANKGFQKTVTDQRETQRLLKMASARLQEVYGGAGAAPAVTELLQGAPAATVAGNSGKHAGAAGVLGLLAELAGDSAQLEADAIAEEAKAQSEYEHLVADSFAAAHTLRESMVQKQSTMASTKEDLGAATEALHAVVKTLEGLAKEKGDLHSGCDFFLQNFEVRQKAISDEIEGLQQAKSILSGAQ